MSCSMEAGGSGRTAAPYLAFAWIHFLHLGSCHVGWVAVCGIIIYISYITIYIYDYILLYIYPIIYIIHHTDIIYVCTRIYYTSQSVG